MRKPIILIAILILAIQSVGLAQTDESRKKNFNIKKGTAIEGYDPVSYFSSKPVEGSSEFKTTYKGVAYQFANKGNLDKFNTNPTMYEPAYGGWCAFAMGDTGEKVKIDPETYKIVAGKLYLFYNFWGNNTLEDWNKNEKGLQSKGDVNWSKTVGH